MNPNILLLLVVTLVWGTTFPLLKSATADLSGLEVSALRFVIAAVCMAPFLLRTHRRVWRDGALLGGLVLLSYVMQAYGMQFISSNRNAFLTGLNVLMVPLLGMLFGRKPARIIVLASVLACGGIGLLSWEGGGNLIGDSATIFSALLYALYVIALSRYAPHHAPRQLAATQITLMAVFGCIGVLVSEVGTPALATLPERMSAHWPTLLYLGAVASAGMLFLQAMAQRHVSAEKAAIVYAMEPVFAAVFGWVLLGEWLGTRGLAGGALVVLAMILCEWRPKPRTAQAG